MPRLLSLLALAVLAVPALAAEPSFVVSTFDLGAVDQIRIKDADLAAELRSQEWCEARGQAAPAWQQIPRGVSPEQWLSVVTVGFGRRAEAYAFQFTGPVSGPRLVAHVPHWKQPIRGVEQWTSPFPKLTSSLRVAYPEWQTAASPRPLMLEISETQSPAEPKPNTTSKTNLNDALTLSPDKVLPPLRVIVTAAACAAGWSPSPESSARETPQARLEVRVLDQACSFRLTFTSPQGEQVFVRERVPWEEYHDQLAFLFRLPSLGRNVVDYVRPFAGKAELLAAEQGRLLCLVDDELAALDAATGMESWRVRIPQNKLATVPKRIERYAVRRDAKHGTRVYRWTTGLAEVAIADGKLTPLAPVAANAPFAFDVATTGEVAVVNGKRLALLSNGREAWSHSASGSLTCGPKFVADRVLVGDDQGDLLAFSRTDGGPLWKLRLGARLYGTIETASDLCFAFSNGDETLHAIDPATGARKWDFVAGDVLVQPPLSHDDSLIVVTKQNRLVRLNPATGATLADERWPTWIVSVSPVSLPGASRLALADVSGRLSLLGTNLRSTWETKLPGRLTGNVVLASAPPVWKATSAATGKNEPEDLLETIAADVAGKKLYLLTTDAAGFVYKLRE